MGFHFTIILGNSKTEETKVITKYLFGHYFDCWKDATKFAEDEMRKLWSPAGDGSYWYIQSVSDTTRR